LAALAHEIKNSAGSHQEQPVLLGPATSGNEPARRAQAGIERQVVRLARLASDLLDVTRLAQNKIKLPSANCWS